REYRMRSKAPSIVASDAVGFAKSRISVAASDNIVLNSGALSAALRIFCRNDRLAKDGMLDCATLDMVVISRA
ncbi:MAG TPA: hypothetical protein VN181_09975, partial [Thermoanaerobaculia bacterium]|nr:hypothetical protein [Thermoanaerobaculia bacterium]